MSVMIDDSEFGFGLTKLVLQVLLILQVPNTYLLNRLNCIYLNLS